MFRVDEIRHAAPRPAFYPKRAEVFYDHKISQNPERYRTQKAEELT
jgi:hypothetical protein